MNSHTAPVSMATMCNNKKSRCPMPQLSPDAHAL